MLLDLEATNLSAWLLDICSRKAQNDKQYAKFLNAYFKCIDEARDCFAAHHWKGLDTLLIAGREKKI